MAGARNSAAPAIFETEKEIDLHCSEHSIVIWMEQEVVAAGQLEKLERAYREYPTA